MTFDTNLKLGQNALAYTRHHLHHSSTFPDLTFAEMLPALKMIKQTREAKLSSIKLAKIALKNFEKTSFLNQKIIVKKSKKSHTGNCGEYAAMTLKYLRKHTTISAEMVEIIDGDHVFVVIGRLPDSDINDYRTWGPDAVVCDAWANQAYPAHQIPEKLRCYVYDSVAYKNRTYPFNPQINQLQVMHAIDHNTALFPKIINMQLRRLDVLISAVELLSFADPENEEIKKLLAEIEKNKAELKTTPVAAFEDEFKSPVIFSNCLGKINSLYLDRFFAILKKFPSDIQKGFLTSLFRDLKEMLEAEKEPASLFETVSSNKEDALKVLITPGEIDKFTANEVYLLATLHEAFYKEISTHPEILSRLSEQHIRGLNIRYSYLQQKTTSFSAYGKQPFFTDSVATEKNGTVPASTSENKTPCEASTYSAS